ncbi:MAG: peptidoglycan-binding protein [Proteobacteria bacterium]|nr:peptidoglycan-binding protein [Pseudomonadota bacterium]
MPPPMVVATAGHFNRLGDLVPGTGPSKDVRGVLPAGTRLNDYEIISVLGQGGFGVTYLARDTRLEDQVVLKEYLPTSLALRDGIANVLPRTTDLGEPFAWGRERFVAEARALSRLGQVPAIVRVLDLLEANGTVYLVMAPAEGEPLRRRLLRDNILPPAVIERMFSSLLDALQEAHAAGLLHHDIKPANIIVDARGNPTLIDFGAARAAMAGRTAAMAASFTPGYAAAEQFSSAKQGPWTDIYGLSATLYHAITGAPPPSTFDRMLDDTYQPLAKLMPAGFSPGLLIGIDAGLALRPDERPQSIADWRAILPPAGPLDEPATFVMRGPSAAARTIHPSRAGTRRSMGLWIGVAAAILVAAVVADGALKLTAPVTEATDPARRPVVAQSRQQTAPDAAATAGMATTPAASDTPATPSEVERATVETARREEDTQQARESHQKTAVEATQSSAEAAARAAAQDAAQRQAAEEAQRQADASAAKAAERPPPTAAELRQQAEKAEATLNLSERDRRRVQTALTALGHPVSATGYFGPITRSMISAWQKTQGLPDTGFLDATQFATLGGQVPPEAEARQAEVALNLSDQDRKRVQVALTALGHTVPTTGYFGSISRSMIAAWQKTQDAPATGYLTAVQFAALQQQAAAALAKYDQARRKAKEP